MLELIGARQGGLRCRPPTIKQTTPCTDPAADSSEYIGWEIINVVYREIDGQMQEIGMFEGCIQGGFRDLDLDGTPEVLTATKHPISDESKNNADQ